MKNRSFKSNDKYEEKLEYILSEKGISFSDYIRDCIDKDFKMSPFMDKSNFNKSLISEKKTYIRLFHDDEIKLREIADKKGVSFSKEIRFRISSTLGTNLFDWNEAMAIKDSLNEVSKVGRLMNQAIKHNLLLGGKDTRELSQAISELRKTFLKVLENAIKRVR